MSSSDALFEDFLNEVQGLEDFRTEYQSRYSFAQLGQDDPDVRRLMEAMAYYSARTRRVAEREMDRHRRAALESLFPQLLSPMPAMSVVYPRLGSNMTDPRVVPAHAPFVLSDSSELSAAPGSGRRFRTVGKREILPLHIVQGSVSLERRGRPARTTPEASGWSLKLAIAASERHDVEKPQRDVPEYPFRELCVYLNPADNLVATLRLWDALSSSLGKARCRFSSASGHLPVEQASVSFGSRRVSDEAIGLYNPIERIRRAFHCPQAELCFTIQLGRAPSEWTRLDIELELDETWPATLVCLEESFLLNALVVEDLETAIAEPVPLDGTKVRLPIEHSVPVSGRKLREVLGVYVVDSERPGAAAPLMPSALAPGGYVVHVEGKAQGRSAWLELENGFAGDGETARAIHVEADWYDPSRTLPALKHAKLRSVQHDVDAKWCMAEPVALPADSPLFADTAALQKLLELHRGFSFTATELRILLQAAGAEGSEVFGALTRRLREVSVSDLPDARSMTGSSRLYHLAFEKTPPALMPALRFLLRYVPELLATWTGDADVSVRATVDGQATQDALWFEWRTNSER